MEKFSELIRIRRSMRKFTEDELTQDEVVALLRAALISPSSKGVRPWEFVVVDNKELLQQLAHSKEHGAELIEGAPLAVVILADPTQSDVCVDDDHDAVAGGGFGARCLLGTNPEPYNGGWKTCGGDGAGHSACPGAFEGAFHRGCGS